MHSLTADPDLILYFSCLLFGWKQMRFSHFLGTSGIRLSSSLSRSSSGLYPHQGNGLDKIIPGLMIWGSTNLEVEKPLWFIPEEWLYSLFIHHNTTYLFFTDGSLASTWNPKVHKRHYSQGHHISCLVVLKSSYLCLFFSMCHLWVVSPPRII